ncbi:hypothetical protein, partial [uncultured Mitsuokella sp.]|uniref:hypothetical protein n=1 Tax=uncultured Mitsuokella sp. TaxID=453120 RepID=UPI0026305C88
MAAAAIISYTPGNGGASGWLALSSGDAGINAKMANADADAFAHNEWQALIDSKDYKGLFEKDPVRMTQAIMRMNEA